MMLARIGLSNRWVALTVLALVAVFNYLDRTILSILQVPIKRELLLTDAQLGALTGLAFALFYTTLALPIARLADRTVRKIVIAVALLVWSSMTAFTGLATGFLLLLLLRIGVAIGEAGSVPATHSMLADLFPREQRATALSLWGLSAPIGMMLGLAGAGWLEGAIGWRMTFVVIGGMGVLLAPLLLLAVREPERGRYDDPTVEWEAPRWREAMTILWRLKTFRYVAAAGAMTSLVQHALSAWNATFYVRAHHMPLPEVAGWLALMNGAGGAVGIFLGGTLSDWLGRRFVRGYLLPATISTLLVTPLGVWQYLTPSTSLSLALGAVTCALSISYFACVISVAQSVAPPRIRAFTSAMLVLIMQLFGMGLGALLTGVISDHLGGDAAGASLRHALAAMMLPGVLAALLYWRAAGALVRDLPSRTAKPAMAKAS